MICSDPQCTGFHDRNHKPWAEVCPRTKEGGLARDRKRYDNQTWYEHHAKQLKTRRLKALQRIERMKGRGMSGEI
jgi:hypothetical protein